MSAGLPADRRAPVVARGHRVTGRDYDARVERPTDPPAPGDRPPNSRDGGSAAGGTAPRLGRAPGERYGSRANPETDPDTPRTGGSARAIALAAAIGIAGSVVIVMLGGVLALSAGLVVVAGAIGWLIGGTLRGVVIGPRAIIAAALAVESVLVAQVGLWLFAQSEGGALGLFDYLAQTWGWIVVAEAAAAALAAWWSAR